MKQETLGEKIGSICVIIYALFSVISAGASFFCTLTLCKAGLAYPVLPWPLLLASLLKMPIAFYPVLLLLNAVLLYLLGVAIGTLITSHSKKENW